MADIFTLVGRIAIDNSEANTSIDNTTQKAKDLGDELDEAGKSADSFSEKAGEKSKFGAASVFMGSILAEMATSAAKLATNLIKTGIGMASELEQSIGGVETLFGDAAIQVFENADKAYRTAGMSANEYMETVTGFAAALKQSVATEEEAARIADMAIIDMSDNANKMGTSMESIQNAYQGFAKQNYTMLDNLKLGYGGTKEEMERLLSDAEALSGQKYEISSLADMFTAIHVIQQELGIAGTTAEEASTTLSGSASAAKSAWDNFMSNTMLDAIPKLTDAIGSITMWMEKNPEKIDKISNAISSFASAGFEALSNALKWLLENGDSVAMILGTIAAALATGAIATHPYAAAIMAVAAGLAYLNSEAGKNRGEFKHMFDGYSEDELKTLQRWVDAANEAKRAEDAYMESLSNEDYDAYDSAWKRADTLQQEVQSINGLMDAYSRYETANGYGGGNDMHLDVPIQVSEDSESNIQASLDGMTLEGVVKLYPDTTSMNTLYSIATGNGIDGSHASGLEFVPRDNYIARLHKGEAVLTSSQADTWRGGGMGSADVGRLESSINAMTGMLQQLVANSSGTQIVLDSGVLVGQLAPALDTQLGTISTRKGRRN